MHGYHTSFILGCGCGNEVSILISHSFLYFIVRSGNGIFAVASLSIFTRLLSPEQYGVYAIYMGIASVLSVIFFQWLSEAFGRFYPIYIDDLGKVLAVSSTGFWALTLMVALLFLGALPFHEFFGIGPELIVMLFLLTISLGRHNLALQIANAQSDPIRYGMISLSKSSIALFIGFILIFYGLAERGALLGLIVGLALSIIAFDLNLWTRLKPKNSLDPLLAAQMFRYGLPLSLNFLAILIVDLADRFIIGSLLGASHVAPYAVAYDLVQQLVGPVMNVLYIAAFPSIVKVFESMEIECTRTGLQCLGIKLITFGLPIAFGVGVLASDIAEIIFGVDYRQDAALIMPWLAAAIFIAAFKSYFFDLIFLLFHSTKYLVLISILMATLNIALNFLLLPKYGIIAAAWTTLFTFSFGAFTSWLFGRHLFILPALGNVLFGSTSACVFMCLVLFLLPSSSGIFWLLIKIFLGALTYIVVMFTLNVSGCRSSWKL